MNTGIFSFYLRDLASKGYFDSIEEAFLKGAACGITSAEVFSYEFDDLPFDEYKSLLKRHDIDFRTLITVSSFASGESKDYKDGINEMKSYIDLLSDAGIKYLMVVPYTIDVFSLSRKLSVRDTIVLGLNELVSYAKDSGVTVLIENFSLIATPFSTTDEILYLMKNVPGLKLAIDSGNFYCVGDDILKAYDALRGYVTDVHLKDWVYDDFGTIVRPNLPALEGCAVGSGIIPVKELIKKLKSDGYRDHLVIEINSAKYTAQTFFDSINFIGRETNA